MNFRTGVCPDCRRAVSPSTRNCPQCGCPLDGQRRTMLVRATVGAVFLTALAVVAVYFAQRERERSSPPPDVAARSYAPSEDPLPASTFQTSASVCLIVASPDGQTMATAYRGNDVLLSNPRLPDGSATLSGHTAAVRSIAFSPNGGTLASASADQTVKLWDVGSQTLWHELVGHTGAVNAVAFSGDGQMLASAGADKTVRLWNVWTGQFLATLEGHGGEVLALAFNVDARTLASAGADATIRVWDLEDGRQRIEIPTGRTDSIRAMAFGHDGRTLVTLAGDRQIKLWDTHVGRLQTTISVERGGILAASFSPGGNAIATGGVDGRIQTWDVVTGERGDRRQMAHAATVVLYPPDQGPPFSLPTTFEFLTEIGAMELAQQYAAASGAAEKAIAGFGVPDWAKVELFASEEMVANPAAICLDRQGRVFVAETFRYSSEATLGQQGHDFWVLDDLASQSTDDRLRMYQKWADKIDGGMAGRSRYAERIRRLEDTDGDGRADRVTLFSGGYNDPLDGSGCGLIERDGAVYYTCTPKLWLLRDEDDDGQADEKTVLHEGFGVCASQPHDLHGLAWGTDGKLYFSVGDRGYHVETPEGRTLHNPGSGAVFRCNADGSELEEFARGFRNPQELAFDRYGNLFTCDNNSNLGDQPRVVYVVQQGRSGWHMSYETMAGDYPSGPWNMDRLWQTHSPQQAAWIVPPIGHLGAGPGGLVAYPGVGLPERYQDHFFLCDFVDLPNISSIRSFAVKPRGAGFEMVDAHVLVSNILPTDIEFGYDGKVYFSDWILGWSGTGMGRIYTLSDPGFLGSAAAAQNAALWRRGFDSLENDELVALLRHADMRVRLRAQFTLAERPQASTALLARLAAEDSHQLARLHAIWGLGIIGRSDRGALSHVVPLLEDADDEVRAQAAKVLGEGRYAEAAGSLLTRLEDTSARVQYFAAMALGRLEHKGAVAAIVDMLRRNDDQDVFLRHGGVVALARIGDADACVALADDDDRAVRLAALLALRRMDDPRLARFLDDSDESLVVEAARAIHDLPIPAALPALAWLIDRPSTSQSLLRRVINANFRLGDVEQARALARFAADADAPEAMRVEAIGALGDWENPSPRDRVLGFFRPLPTRPIDRLGIAIAPWISQIVKTQEGDLQRETLRLAATMKISLDDAPLIDWIGDDARPLETRIEALRLLAGRDQADRDAAIQAALAVDQPLLRAEAARAIAANEPQRAVELLDDLLDGLLDGESVVAQQRALAILGTIDHASADAALAPWLDRLLAGTAPPPLELDVVEAARRRADPRIANQLAKYDAPLSNADVVRRFRSAQFGGDAGRGRAIFDSGARTQCLRCHKIGERGGAIGPDLSNIGAQQSREYLLESLVAPNRKIAKGYQTLVVTTDDGRVISGIVQSEDSQRLDLLRAQGELITIDKSQIVDRAGGKSVMPDDPVHRLSPLELRDLVEFLAGLKGPVTGP